MPPKTDETGTSDAALEKKVQDLTNKLGLAEKQLESEKEATKAATKAGQDELKKVEKKLDTATKALKKAEDAVDDAGDAKPEKAHQIIKDPESQLTIEALKAALDKADTITPIAKTDLPTDPSKLAAWLAESMNEVKKAKLVIETANQQIQRLTPIADRVTTAETRLAMRSDEEASKMRPVAGCNIGGRNMQFFCFAEREDLETLVHMFWADLSGCDWDDGAPPYSEEFMADAKIVEGSFSQTRGYISKGNGPFFKVTPQ